MKYMQNMYTFQRLSMLYKVQTYVDFFHIAR